MKASKAVFLVFLIILSLCLVDTLPVKPQSSGTIYIRADGTVEGTDKIQRNGNVYTFTDNINGSIIVEKDNIVVDGAGFILQGTGSIDWIGVNLSSRKNVTVKNITIKQPGYDTIRIFDSSNCSILDNTIIIIHGYYPPLIHLNNSSSNVLSGNDCVISLVKSDSNILLGNSGGIRLSKSSNTTIMGNRNSIELTESSNNFISENNSSIKLYTQSKGNIISENIGFIGLWESSNNSITGNNGAILVIESDNNSFIRNTVEDNRPYGIQLGYSSGNNFSENVIQNNLLDIRYVFNNTFYHNDFVNATIDIVDDSVVFWDNGSEGNYWDDYTELDENGDGIGDLPYIINKNNQDNYPLMNPWFPPPPPEPQPSEPFLTWIAVIVIIAVVGAAFLVYFAKIRKATGEERRTRQLSTHEPSQYFRNPRVSNLVVVADISSWFNGYVS